MGKYNTLQNDKKAFQISPLDFLSTLSQKNSFSELVRDSKAYTRTNKMYSVSYDQPKNEQKPV